MVVVVVASRQHQHYIKSGHESWIMDYVMMTDEDMS